MKRPTHKLLSGALLVLGVLMGNPAGAAESVLFVLSERGGAYQEVAQAASALIPQASANVILSAELRERRGAPLIIAVGANACRASMEDDQAGAVVCALLPRITFRRIADAPTAKRKGKSAVVLDQPLARQLALIRHVMPDRRRVGVLLGPDSAMLATPLHDAATEQGLRVATRHVAHEDDLYPAVDRLLKECDVLLALPDRVVLQAGTIQNVLRMSFENRVPVVGLSPAYVRAGAFVSLYSTPAQIGRQAGAIARAHLAGQALPEAQAPQEFEIGVNRHIAQALGINAPDAKAVADVLRRMEKTQ